MTMKDPGEIPKGGWEFVVEADVESLERLHRSRVIASSRSIATSQRSRLVARIGIRSRSRTSRRALDVDS
jgi:Flp pilus assembly CpaE family ATPase